MYFKSRVDADALNQSPFLSFWFQFSIPHVLVSSPFVVCSTVRMADEDNRSEMNGGPESLLGGADAVKIVLHLSKVCLCCLCAAKSTDASPLSTASSLDRWSGNRPCGKTRTVFDQVSGKFVKVPEGKICMICLNVFKLLGHMAKHGSYAEYYKKVMQHLCQESWFYRFTLSSVHLRHIFSNFPSYPKRDSSGLLVFEQLWVNSWRPNTGDHGSFLTCVETWIKDHNADPSRGTLANKKKLQALSTKLVTTLAPVAYFIFPSFFCRIGLHSLVDSQIVTASKERGSWLPLQWPQEGVRAAGTLGREIGWQIGRR